MKMTPQVQQLYKLLYDKAKSFPNSDTLGILPTHFVGEKSRFKKGLPLFVGRDANGLGQNEIPRVSDYEFDSLDWLKDKMDTILMVLHFGELSGIHWLI
jgi:hypothetical protein